MNTQTQPQKKRRVTAAYVIAFHFCNDIKDVQECRYQNYEPAVYCLGDDYYCAPAPGKKLPDTKRFAWTKIGTQCGRDIYECKMNAQIGVDAS